MFILVKVVVIINFRIFWIVIVMLGRGVLVDELVIILVNVFELVIRIKLIFVWIFFGIKVKLFVIVENLVLVVIILYVLGGNLFIV